MSKKAKKMGKAVEIEKDSPDWSDELARKQGEAYDMVHRAMIRSQIDATHAAKVELVRQKAEIEAKAEQQSQDQNDIYQYLRKKLQDNYAVIAELESKVSQAHTDRLQRERELIAKADNQEEEREAEKVCLIEKLETLGRELDTLKEFQENAGTHKAKLRDLEAAIAACKEGFRSEMALLTSQVEDEMEVRQKEADERIKMTKKVAARQTQEQLGPKTKHMITQNKKMMAELRFQCFEVENMQRARQGLLEENTLLLGRAASARHAVQETARRSHLLQRIIRYMHQKLQAKHAAASASNGGAGSMGGGGVNFGGGGVGGVRYKLAGMSDEKRQEMLDLREELRREEVGVAAAQTLIGEMNEVFQNAEADRMRTLTLRTDLARVLASCHEDPLLGFRTKRGGHVSADAEDFTGATTTINNYGNMKVESTASPAISSPQHRQPEHRRKLSPITSLVTTNIADADQCREIWSQTRVHGVQRRADAGQSRWDAGQFREDEAHLRGEASQRDGQGKRCQRGEIVEITDEMHAADDEHRKQLPVWPEDRPLPAGVAGDAANTMDGRKKGTSHLLDVETLKAVSRLFLSKLMVAVELITPRPDPPERISLPVIAGVVEVRTGGGRGKFTGCGHDRFSRNCRNRGFVGGDAESAGRGKGPGYGSGGDYVAGGDSDDGGEGGEGACRRRRGGGGDGGGGGARGDALSVWSDRQTTGIPSWDMLEPAVRQTKRRRTRDAACQTLTYRELRDNACAPATASATRYKTWVSPVSTSIASMSTVSAYGILPGGICSQIAGDSGSPRLYGTTRTGGEKRDGGGATIGNPDGGNDESCNRVRRGQRRLQAHSNNGGAYDNSKNNTHYHPHRRREVIVPQAMPPISPLRRPAPAEQLQQTSRPQHDHCNRQHPQAQDRQRISVPPSKTSATKPAGCALERAMVEIEVGIDADLKRQGGQECQEISGMVLKKEEELAMGSWRGGGASGGRYGYYGYAPLTKGPDYRKVLLFTVDAEDRIFRRPHPNESNGDNGNRNSSNSVSPSSKVIPPPLRVAAARVRGRNDI